ncbi:MAG: cyclic nucleotide-binding domain-containing protein [Desulfobacterales bacterium]|nr:cyclic nucleotide-binding domain-containing protein [Desulfobacterales bacterium]
MPASNIEIELILGKNFLFSELPEDEIAGISRQASLEDVRAGTLLSAQGRTSIDRVYVIAKGLMELYFENKGRKILSATLEPGDIFGGISILMNGGVSARTSQAQTDCELVVLSKELFLEVCGRHKAFRQYFVDKFSDRMLNEAYASILTTSQALNMLADTIPFSFLPEKVLENVAAEIALVKYSAGTVIFIQDRSTVDYLYILHNGAAERYFEQKGKQILKAVLSEGDIFGGISMLLNNGTSVRTLRTTEETSFYILPLEHFRQLCETYDTFSEYFTDTFGKRMLDRSYSAIIAKSLRPREEDLRAFNLDITGVYTKNIVTCDSDATIRDAAIKMSSNQCSSIFIADKAGKVCGLITDNDLRTKVIATGVDTHSSVADIMSTPLATVTSGATVFEALMTMMQQGIKHLAVTDADEKVIGIITNQDLLQLQGQSPLILIREINEAQSIEAIIDKHAKLPRMIQGLINAGAKADNVTRLITTLSDAILKKVVAFTLAESDPPPVKFVFMILGSEGRKEQTLKTDQDNAIIFEDVSSERLDATRAYFLELGEKICRRLDRAGYDFCEGGIMARNPEWCLMLSEWQAKFREWIHAPEPEALLRSSIFFDFRGGYGEIALIDELRDYLFGALSGWPGFFRHLSENAIYFKPPIGFFRNFVVESKGKHKDAFDIKRAMMPIVDLARIYALKNRVDETNTLERLQLLYHAKVLKWAEYHDLEQAYSFMLQMRFVRQITAIIDENRPPDNYVKPKKLSPIEQTMLKEIFKRVEKFQTKLEFDFVGMP